MAVKPELTAKQAAFVEEYLVDLNAAQAAIRAGYAPKNAKQIGQETLRKPLVRAAVDKAMAERSKRVEVEQDRVLKEIARVAFSDPRNLFNGTALKDVCDLDDNTAAAVSSVKVITRKVGDGETEQTCEVKFWSKTAALDMAGKHLGMFERDNRQRNPADAVAAVIAEIQSSAKREVPGGG